MPLVRPRRSFDPQRLTRFALPARPTWGLVRVVLFAVAAVLAAAWGLASHWGSRPAPMLVPAHAAPSATYDADAGEIPVPDLEPAP